VALISTIFVRALLATLPWRYRGFIYLSALLAVSTEHISFSILINTIAQAKAYENVKGAIEFLLFICSTKNITCRSYVWVTEQT